MADGGWRMADGGAVRACGRPDVVVVVVFPPSRGVDFNILPPFSCSTQQATRKIMNFFVFGDLFRY